MYPCASLPTPPLCSPLRFRITPTTNEEQLCLKGRRLLDVQALDFLSPMLQAQKNFCAWRTTFLSVVAGKLLPSRRKKCDVYTEPFWLCVMRMGNDLPMKDCGCDGGNIEISGVERGGVQTWCCRRWQLSWASLLLKGVADVVLGALEGGRHMETRARRLLMHGKGECTSKRLSWWLRKLDLLSWMLVW